LFAIGENDAVRRGVPPQCLLRSPLYRLAIARSNDVVTSQRRSFILPQRQVGPIDSRERKSTKVQFSRFRHDLVASAMGIYQDQIVPLLISWSLRQKDLAAYRSRIIPAAEGRVLEIGIGSGLNSPFSEGVRG